MLIDSLVPALACAEMLSDAPESTLFPGEAAIVSTAVAERRREFATVRHCARRALATIGCGPVPLLPDMHGAPRWPVGVVGSMTHCPGYRAAVVGPAGEVRSIGIDAEPHAAMPEAVLDHIVRDDERVRIRALSDSQPDVHWGLVLFCAKEAVYKAWYPLTRRWLDFADLSLRLDADGTFEAHRSPGTDPAAALLDHVTGRWAVRGGFVLTAVTIGGPLGGAAKLADSGELGARA